VIEAVAPNSSRRFEDAGACRVRVHCAPSRSRLRYVGVAVDTAEEAETA